jgi:hypothetical protein
MFDEVLAFYRGRGLVHEVRSAVLVKVERALPLTSPSYDHGASEEEVRGRWGRHYQALGRGEGKAPKREGPATTFAERQLSAIHYSA